MRLETICTIGFKRWILAHPGKGFYIFQAEARSGKGAASMAAAYSSCRLVISFRPQ